jgi:hypothetical protein
MKYYFGPKQRKNYFEGWYFKHTSKNLNIAFIPSISIVNQYEKKAFIQVISNLFTERFEFDYSDFHAKANELHVQIKENIFSSSGIALHLTNEKWNIKVNLNYSSFTKLSKDIMGPFKHLPLMECKHNIFSMKHDVFGTVTINDKEYVFHNDLGYLEGDYGSSFPTKYIWMQSNQLINGAFFLSIATIPYGKLHFTGIIGSLLIENKEYRFATYRGTKILVNTKDHIKLKHKNLILDVFLQDSNQLLLSAPKNGDMTRKVYESMQASIEIVLTKNKMEIFRETANQASIEIG